ncbi:hypothetical protein E3N88_18347 [Mikania micrantha]|uniref:Retrotransposon gag domain-containing protein n=1 Tax=Mikania micrantha TaxID=192012 RepID=A0A5N6NUL7_9ASTR|nr:hypothetical protein E3N88_18347 [Mikania micrantha]
MVNTRSNPSEGSASNPDPVAAQLAAIAAKLDSIDALKDEVAALKSHVEKSKGGYGRFEDGGANFRPFQRNFCPYNKIEFPSFSEGDQRGWILKAENYFRYYNIPEEEKVDVGSMHLEGDALDLFSWLSTDQEIEFCIKQTGSVQAYRQEFAERLARVTNWPDHCLLGVFLNGLKEELKADVRLHKPRTVYKAMSVALEYESKICNTKPSRFFAGNQPFKANFGDSKPTSQGSSQPVTTKAPLRISDSEKQARYLKGECFRCGDKYGPCHRYKTGTLKLLEIEEANFPNVVEGEEVITEVAGISLHAILGKAHPTTMKIHGLLQYVEVLVLVDGGSTHNFISEVLVNELKLATQPVEPFGVHIGNGDVIRCNLVLGVQWLATLNTVQANWKEMYMIFNIDRKKYKWQGVSSGPHKSSSFQYLALEPEILTNIPDAIHPPIHKYSTVFDEPTTLLPHQNHTHSIILQPNSTPPNIRPYQYPFSQKTEIENQVEQLLSAGFIQPSHSPFSSPVLLVKKKDQS